MELEGLHDDLIKKLIYLRAKIEVNYLDPSAMLSFLCLLFALLQLAVLCGNLEIESAQIHLKVMMRNFNLLLLLLALCNELARLHFFLIN